MQGLDKKHVHYPSKILINTITTKETAVLSAHPYPQGRKQKAC
jgi:hypothetical protein